MKERNDIEERYVRILEENKASIQRICGVYAKNAEDKKDLIQDVFFQIWKALPRFEGKSSLATWIYRITLNVCLRSPYQKHSRNKIQLDSVVFDPISDPPKNLEYESLYQCISKLPQVDRSIIILFLEDLPYKEIASIVGISENHVAVKIKRIKTQLFHCLKTYENE